MPVYVVAGLAILVSLIVIAYFVLRADQSG